MKENLRNLDTPLYVWINRRESINNVRENARMHYRPPGNEIVYEVLTRFVRLYDVDVTQLRDLLDTLITRYRSRWNAMPNDIQKLTYSGRYKGIIRVEPHPDYPKISELVADPTSEELRRLKKLNQIVKAEPWQDTAIEDDEVKIVTSKTKIKVINRLTKGWEKHYFNLQTKPDKIPSALKEIDELVEIPSMHPPGVYFLCQENQVVYVGQSKNPSARIAQHLVDKQFNRVFMIPTNNLDEVESAYIKKFKPKYNKAQIKG
jgi:hypothetical protein